MRAEGGRDRAERGVAATGPARDRRAAPTAPITSLGRRFASQLAETSQLAAGTPIIVALSGGLDSQVLLHLLRFGAPTERVILAAHFDHRMRADSGSDAAWVRGLCLAWDVPLCAATSLRPLRSETAARLARYEYLDALAWQLPGAVVATAHHADDQAETVLLRLLRGTGVRGLRGIPARRRHYVRPLLSCTRAELTAYAAAVGIRARPDPSNLDLSRPRNFVRHVVLPVLEARRAGARDLLLRIAALAATQERSLAAVLDEAEHAVARRSGTARILLASTVLLAYHPRIQALLLRRVLRRLGSRPGRAGTRVALQFISAGKSGRCIAMPGGVVIEHSFDTIIVRRQATPALDAEVEIAKAGSGTGIAEIGGRRCVVRWELAAPAADRLDAARTEAIDEICLDPAAVNFPLVVRGWRPGDRLRLPYGRKKLKKLFGELRLGRLARSRIPVLAEDRGRVLWIAGYVRSVDARPGSGTVLRVTVADG